MLMYELVLATEFIETRQGQVTLVDVERFHARDACPVEEDQGDRREFDCGALGCRALYDKVAHQSDRRV